MTDKFLEWLESPVDLRPQGLYRIGLGLIIIGHIVGWAPYLTELFSNQGFHLGIWAPWAPSPIGCVLLMLALFLSSLLLTVGLWSRLATVMTLVLFTFFTGIDTINEKALYSMISINLIIGCFSPWGDYLSMTWWRNTSKNRETFKTQGNPIFIRLWQVGLLQMYFFAGLIKTHHEGWWNGEVLQQIMMGRWSSAIGLWLSGVLPDSFYPWLTVGTIVFELLLPFFLLWPKTRLLAVLLGVLFHLAIEVTLNIGLLGMHSILCLLVFFLPEGNLDFRTKIYAWVENVRTAK